MPSWHEKPLGQGSHSLASVRLMAVAHRPAGHGTGAVEPRLQKWPAVHCSGVCVPASQ